MTPSTDALAALVSQYHQQLVGNTSLPERSQFALGFLTEVHNTVRNHASYHLQLELAIDETRTLLQQHRILKNPSSFVFRRNQRALMDFECEEDRFEHALFGLSLCVLDCLQILERYPVDLSRLARQVRCDRRDLQPPMNSMGSPKSQRFMGCHLAHSIHRSLRPRVPLNTANAMLQQPLAFLLHVYQARLPKVVDSL